MEFQRRKYKEFAIKQLSGRWKTAVLATLIMGIVSIVFSIPSQNNSITWEELQQISGYSYSQIWDYLSSTGQVTPLKTVFSLIENIVAMILSIAISHLFITYSHSPEPVSLRVFFEGFNKWGRGILAGLWEALWYFLWMMACLVLCFVIGIPLALIFPDNETLISLTAFAIIVLMFVVLIIKSIEYSHHVLLVAEFPEIGIRKALRISILITKGHRWDIFVTSLTFIPLIIFGCITLGIGLLWVAPYIRLCYINIYHALLKDAIENGKLHPEDFNS